VSSTATPRPDRTRIVAAFNLAVNPLKLSVATIVAKRSLSARLAETGREMHRQETLSSGAAIEVALAVDQ
jgi:hypothetical protein